MLHVFVSLRAKLAYLGNAPDDNGFILSGMPIELENKLNWYFHINLKIRAGEYEPLWQL